MDRWTAWLILAALAVAAPIDAVLAQGGAQRSAQGDCVREVERRGYSVLWTGNFEQSRDGWQVEVRARNHRGQVTTGTCFVETRTGDVSLYGFGWGGSSAPESFQFTCASKDERYRECQLPIDGRAKLVKKKSDAPCREGYSWGQRGDRVWVDHGCRGKFEVIRFAGGGGGGGSGNTIDCRSTGNRYAECSIRQGREGRLVRDYTGRCRKDSTWGTRPGVVWVTNGCQGRFEVVKPGGGGGGSGGSSNADEQRRAEVQCRTQAALRGMTVQSVSTPRDHGSYWQANVEGKQQGRHVSADCRYYPASDEVTLRY
jgi:hypothetical protein